MKLRKGKLILTLALALITVVALAIGASATAYEAENAALSGTAHVVDSPKAYGGMVVDGINEKGALAFVVEIPEIDEYSVRVYYRNPEAKNCGFDIMIDDLYYELGTGDSTRGSRWIYEFLTPGEHTVYVVPKEGYECPQIDMLLVEYRYDYGMGGEGSDNPHTSDSNGIYTILALASLLTGAAFAVLKVRKTGLLTR